MLEKNMLSLGTGTMLNLYPDSLGGTLADVADFLSREEVKGAFSSLYILPSLYNSDLDRGFSVISYDLNEQLAKSEDIAKIQSLGMDLKLDFLLNHASVLCPEFQDIIKQGENSLNREFFIDWNLFWEGCGHMTKEGYIQPEEKYLKDMFFRKPGLPILMVRFPDGRSVPYWNTFYQEVQYPRVDEQDLMRIVDIQYDTAKVLAELVNRELNAGKPPSSISFMPFERYGESVVSYLEANRKYLGQMDLNIKSPLVWEYYRQTLNTLAGYGAKIVRLDAFAYAPKAPGKRNFLNEPETWELLQKVREQADEHSIVLLPEIHSSYEEKTHEKISEAGYPCYDFFLPGLIIDAFERGQGVTLCNWAQEMWAKKIQVVNMLGCHDGIPLLDLKGILSEERISSLIDTVVKHGGLVKDLHGQKNVYYQVNATYYSALGEDDRPLLLARAIQLFMPGKPQVWYLDLFAGKNDIQAVKNGGSSGHKEINRTNLTRETIEAGMKKQIVKDQLSLLRFRNSCKAFGFDAEFRINCTNDSGLEIFWERGGCSAELIGDMRSYAFSIISRAQTGAIEYHFTQQ